jgi:GTP-binding protein HflX
VGSGKVEEAKKFMEEHDCCTIVFDAELTPGQQKALENAFNKNLLQNDFLVQEGEIKVIDRTALILDIFAQHAKTREGKLQVDLALHEYRKPRLTKMWTHLERQSGAGGVGLRGPGESQLEIDRRLVRDRIITLKQKIDDVQKQRELHRRGRDRMGLPILSLVGYTNAGKSTLLNFLTRAGVMAESMLFATLDPTTRKVKLPGYKTHPEVLLTDTVGFIQKLPTNLVAAFRATLEEVKEADVLVHVIDVASPTWEKQEQAVNSVLVEIGAGDKPIVRVYNKIDLLDPEDAQFLIGEAAKTPNSVAVSALNGDGMQDFVAVVEEALADLLVPIEVEIPYSKGDELNLIHEVGNVETIDYRENGTYIVGRVPRPVAMRLEQYNVNAVPVLPVKQETNDAEEIDWAAIGRGRHSATQAET